MNSKFELREEIFHERIVKGKALKIGERTLYPVIQILCMENGKFWFESILPLALAVVDSDTKYLIPLTEADDLRLEYPELDKICQELGIKITVKNESDKSKYESDKSI